MAVPGRFSASCRWFRPGFKGILRPPIPQSGPGDFLDRNLAKPGVVVVDKRTGLGRSGGGMLEVLGDKRADRKLGRNLAGGLSLPDRAKG